jgi:crossover junction endodeoxyribonuclease RuvC
MTSTFIGIDPGKSGAIAVLRTQPLGQSLAVFDCPIAKGGKKSKDSYDVAGMAKILADAKESPNVHCIIESVHSMPGQGVSSMFDFGKGFGMWLGILGALKIPYTLVSPVRWKKIMLADVKQDKGASRIRAKQLFPDEAEFFDRVRDDGRAEASMMALYGRQTQGALAPEKE